MMLSGFNDELDEDIDLDSMSNSNLFNNNNQTTMYDALSHPVNIDEGHEPNWNVYRDGGKPQHGFFNYKSPFSGYIKCPKSGKYWLTDEFQIAYTQRGDKGPIVLMLHGVPSNRRLYFPIQKRLSPFCRTVSIDMLGMGESSKPRYYGKAFPGKSTEISRKEEEYAGINEPWDWVFDTDYVDKLMNELYPGEKFVFVSDDWGSGICTHFAAKFDDTRLNGFVNIDPIQLGAYPVSEIQAVGRSSQIPVTNKNGVDDADFKAAMGAFDQTVVQIEKTMTYNRHPWDQYTLRDIKYPYIDVDYERSAYEDGEDATSLTLRLKWEAIRVLADRAAILAPALLLPYHPEKNPKGVNFKNITVPYLGMSGRYDSMMSRNANYRFAYALKNASAQILDIPDADHFAGTDQPNFVSAAIINFVQLHLGKDDLADIFLGFDGKWKGNEKETIEDLRQIYNL